MSDFHELNFQVRDYELDMQGVVNNSVYGNYFEHARHEFLIDRGVDFAALANEGIHLVVVKIEIDYKRSLRSRDTFVLHTCARQLTKLKFQFEQKILLDDNTLVAQALVTGVAVDAKTQRPMRLSSIGALFGESH